MADDDGVKSCNPSRRTSLAVPCEWCPAPAWRESARLAKAVSVAQKTAPPRQWSVRGTTGKTKARRLSTQGCWIGAGSASGDRRRPDPPDRRTAFRGGVGYEHECSRRLPLLRCPPLMMIIIGGKSLFGTLDEKRHRRSSGPWRWSAAGRGISKGETEGGGAGPEVEADGTAGLLAAPAGSRWAARAGSEARAAGEAASATGGRRGAGRPAARARGAPRYGSHGCRVLR